jgi:alpha-beta hydrolase superfamily lysophospholipase
MIRIRDLSNVSVERVEFPSAGGVVRGLHYAGGNSPTCVVIAHGYSSSKHNVDPLAFYLATEGLRAITFDFQGHKLGCSSLPLRQADDLIRNVRDAVAFARTVSGVRTVVAAGHSMGAAATIGAAIQSPHIDAVIAMCTAFGRSESLNGPTMLGGLRNRAVYVDGPAPQSLTSTMDACTARIAEIAPRPVLVIAASRDAIVGPSAVRALFDAAAEPKTLEVVDATHTDCAERAKFAVMRWLRARGFSPQRSNG